ncbi:hypothetical protein [Candidatus Nitrosotenuis uzonensis]|uniref:Uncharacterized protein n=1 Tax=Candidatus Nitrosotenuis uzonensis TaxID=1407055 RepID=A0A812F5X9_9ARCH|nr:hypothetical protein [Candidatus Nitrosotenuis uzonensis]CAE6500694.1 conserved hypothetical protein [Candidatus Nitrosotenuis uzonensis]
MSDNGEKSLAEKLDIAIENLSVWHRVTLVMVIIGLLSLSVVISLSQYYFHQEISKHGQIIEIKDESGNVELVFDPNSDDIFSTQSILNLYTTQVWLMASNGLVIGLLSFLFLWITYRGHAYRKELRAIENQLIRQSYLVNFETSIPEGNDRIDKILNHSCLVFPELQSLLGGKTDRKKLPYRVDQTIGRQKIDVIVSTKRGDFIVKFFDYVSVQTLEQFTDDLAKSGKAIFRVLCISKNYDEQLQSSQLSSIMQRLNLDFDMDLIFEDEQGYSMLWIN